MYVYEHNILFWKMRYLCYMYIYNGLLRIKKKNANCAVKCTEIDLVKALFEDFYAPTCKSI